MTENPNNNANQFDPALGDISRIRQGSVGKSAPGCQTRLHLQDPVDGIGEVASNGRNVFMGYLGDATKTRETFDRGFWLLSGDMATIEDGFVTIKGRIKDVIITSGGKNIAPYPIEEKIKAELGDFVSNCVVVGDKQKHLACLLTVRAVHDPLTMEATPQVDSQINISVNKLCLNSIFRKSRETTPPDIGLLSAKIIIVPIETMFNKILAVKH